ELFHENTMKNATNLENEWMVQMWADGTYITLNALGYSGYEDYSTHPIIFLSASKNNGEDWSEPIEVTDIYSTEVDFMDQITVYPYLCNEIEDLGNGWGKVHLSYMDDNSFGSFIHGAGQNNGGQLMYGSLKINFDSLQYSVENQPPVDITSISLKNTPNPFYGSTRISFSAPQYLNDAIIKIYNTKGQLVKTFTPGEDNSVTWYGKDKNNCQVGNGIYLYKLETQYGNVVNKMLLSR
ncbi:MAG: T9SS type A sorting domain-containing protein, partial [Candidatus Cloacimonetes bacterium]|nr:T9SS type A sorting domain-containing protein [Candidatus Cloacimonadota bacterium]